MAALRTNRPNADAAIAHAAFTRSCSTEDAAMQPTSWKRPFKATISVDFKPTFRRVMFELTHRGRCRHWPLTGMPGFHTRGLADRNGNHASSVLLDARVVRRSTRFLAVQTIHLECDHWSLNHQIFRPLAEMATSYKWGVLVAC